MKNHLNFKSFDLKDGLNIPSYFTMEYNLQFIFALEDFSLWKNTDISSTSDKFLASICTNLNSKYQ